MWEDQSWWNERIRGEILVYGNIYGDRMLSSIALGTTLVLRVCGICR